MAFMLMKESRGDVDNFNLSNNKSGENSNSMFDDIEDSPRYRMLYIKLIWNLAIFVLTVNVVASIFQGIENHRFENGGGGILDRIENRNKIIEVFCKKYNVSLNTTNELLEEYIEANDHGSHVHNSYTDVFLFSLFLFMTIGWGPVFPKTTGGKLFCMIGACFGIPITFNMINTGAKILIRHITDIIRISQSDYVTKYDRYIEKRVNISTKSLLIPSLMVLMVVYVFVSSAVIAHSENINYIDAMYYCYMTVFTIGLGPFVQRNRSISEMGLERPIVATVFWTTWTIFGVIIMAGILHGLLQTHEKRTAKEDMPTFARVAHCNFEDIDNLEETIL